MSDVINIKIVDRIRKLMDLSKDNSNVNEAAGAFAKAQELLSKHRLTMAEVEAASNVSTVGEPITKSAPLYSGERVVHWKMNLADYLAKCNGCKMFVSYSHVCRECDSAFEKNKTTGFWHCPKCIANLGRKKRSDYVVAGRPSDIEIVDYLFQSIVVQIEIMCKRHMMQGDGTGKTWSNNFKMGAIDTVIDRLKNAHDTVRKEYVGSAAMVLVDKQDAEVEAFVRQAVPKMGVLKASPSQYDNSARDMGRKAGQRVTLVKGMGEKKGGGLLS